MQSQKSLPGASTNATQHQQATADEVERICADAKHEAPSWR